MSTPIVSPSKFVPPFAIAFADVAGNAALVAGAMPLPVAQAGALPAGANLIGQMTPAYSASGLTPVTGSIAGPAQSGSFTPVNGRDFNVTLVPNLAGTNTAQVERKFVGDAAWYAVFTDAMRQSVPPSFTLAEPESGVQYRINVLAGTFSIRISQ